MNKRKVCIVLTTRGNYAKMQPVMRAVVADPDLKLQLIVGGDLMLRRYGHNIIQKISEEFKIDQKISFVIEGENPLTMAKSAGLAVGDFATAFRSGRASVVRSRPRRGMRIRNLTSLPGPVFDVSQTEA